MAESSSTAPGPGEWVLLSYRLPREPSGPRTTLWRRLKRLGVAQLSDGLVAFPPTPAPARRWSGWPTTCSPRTGSSAAVVGVIANLALFFATGTLFGETVTVDAGPLHLQLPDLTTLRPVPLLIALVAAVLLFRIKWSVLRTLGVCALLGLAAGLAGLPVG